MQVGDTVAVLVNSNWAGTERKEVEGVVVQRGPTAAWVRIRDEVAEYLRTYRAVETGRVSISELSVPLFRTIKRKRSRDFPSIVAGDEHPAPGVEV